MSIPRQFHFVFGLKKQTEPFHISQYVCLESCLQVNRPERVFFYYHYEPFGPYWDRIKNKLLLEKVELIPQVSKHEYQETNHAPFRYAHQSDFIRLEKLFERGGVYADIDTLFIKPLPERLFNKPFVLGREHNILDPTTRQQRQSLCNAFIMSEKGADFGHRWLQATPDVFNGTWSAHSTLLPQELSLRHPHLIHIEPVQSFYSYPASSEGLITLFEEIGPIDEAAYSVHLWSHLWWSSRRVDYTTFHAGMLTEAFIRREDTTYNQVARKFLPPPRKVFSTSLRSLAPRRRPSVGKLPRVGAALAVRALVKIGFYSLGRSFLPNARGHLAYARRQWRYYRTSRKLQFRTSFEETILASLTIWDEYGLDHHQFTASDVIIDIGAHIGIFSYLCHEKGARNIHAYEPEVSNFQNLSVNLARLKGVYLHKKAVFRSDRAGSTILTHSGYRGGNTGAGTVMLAGRLWGVNRQDVIEPNPKSVQQVQGIGLDVILRKFDRVKLLKLDCEGSEFPILLTSRELHRVNWIVGEYHEFNEDMMAQLEPQAQLEGFSSYHSRNLVPHLEQAGFRVVLQPKAPNVGMFKAKRIKRKGELDAGY